MKIIEYVAAHDETRGPTCAEFTTIEELLSLPLVAKHRVQRGFTLFSIANGDTLIMEYEARGKPTFKVVGRIFEPDPKVLSELPVWQP